MQESKPRSGCMITTTGELSGYVGEKEAVECYQSSSTTITDLRARARKDTWPVTMRAVFREAYKFFGDEDVRLMCFAIHQGEDRFDIYHSGEGELDEKDQKVCEILSQLAIIKESKFFIPSRDPEPISELLRSSLGDFSFAVVPLYSEREPDQEGFDEWRKHMGCLVGTFTITFNPGRPQPTQEEWLKWCMFIPRAYQIMEAARDAGRLKFCDMRDTAEAWSEWKWAESFRTL